MSNQRPSGTHHIPKAPSLRGGAFAGISARPTPGTFDRMILEAGSPASAAFVDRVEEAKRMLANGSSQDEVLEQHGRFVLRAALWKDAAESIRKGKERRRRREDGV